MIALNDGIFISKKAMLSQEISNSTVGGIDSNQIVGGLNNDPSVIRTNKRQTSLETLMGSQSNGVISSNNE